MLEFIKTHWVEIAAAISFLHILAKLIVGLTPNPRDNEFLEKIVVIIKQIVSIIGLQPPVHTILNNNTSLPKEETKPS